MITSACIRCQTQPKLSRNVKRMNPLAKIDAQASVYVNVVRNLPRRDIKVPSTRNAAIKM